MSPFEAGVRAACQAAGAEADSWRAFAGLGLAGVNALLAALPADLASQVREHLHREPPSRSPSTEAT